MPGGDDDEMVEDDMGDPNPTFDVHQASQVASIDQGATLESSKPPMAKDDSKHYQTAAQIPVPNEGKFLALYDDAKHRLLRKEHIYANCIDQECTFKPKLITQHSKVSKNTVREV